MKVIRLSVLNTGCLYPQGNIYSTHLRSRLSRPQGHSVAGRMKPVKKGKGKGKGKAVPLQAWTGPEVSRKLRFPDFVTTAQDGGRVASLTHRPSLPPGNTLGTHFC